MITLITPTGDRPIPLDLCFKTFGKSLENINDDIQWIIADDGATDQTSKVIGDNADILIKNKLLVNYVINDASDGIRHSNLVNNLLGTVDKIIGDQIIIIEDDDWYGRGYLHVVLLNLLSHDVVGLGNPIYYNYYDSSYLPRKRTNHASLCNTAFNRKCLDKFKEALEEMKDINRLFDVQLWKKFRQAELDCFLFYRDPTYFIAMKGLPGRQGIGLGHKPNRKFIKDEGRKKLRKWMDPCSFDQYLLLDDLNV